jgi:signal recognition particle subunit SRP9
MWLTSWDEFNVGARALLLSSADRARLVLKYCHKSQLLEVKVTDDNACLKYKTDTADDIKRIDKLAAWAMKRYADVTEDER